MDMAFKSRFMTLWKKYFNDSPLPITFYYADDESPVEKVKPGSEPRCVIGALAKVREGKSLAFDVNAVGCPGGKKYLGFTDSIMPDFEYFLSCGIPGKLDGERYKKSPEMVKDYMEKQAPVVKAPGRFIVFKRWDALDKADNPQVVIFYAEPDVLAGLFTLAVYDENAQDAIIAPFGSGCAGIVQYPFMEVKSPRPRAIIGMFDVSARPFVPQNTLTFSIPLAKFKRMVDNIEESFLITQSWAKVQKRIK